MEGGRVRIKVRGREVQYVNIYGGKSQYREFSQHTDHTQKESLNKNNILENIMGFCFTLFSKVRTF